MTNTIKLEGGGLDSVVCRHYNLLGDIFHHDAEKNGNYHIDGVRGHINIRAINRNIGGLDVKRPHGQQGFFDGRGVLIQDLSKVRRRFLDGKLYLHFTHLERSSGRNQDSAVPKRELKYRRELGIEFPKDFYYPEVFFRPRLEMIPSPWLPAPRFYKLLGSAINYPRSIKKVLLSKSGY